MKMRPHGMIVLLLAVVAAAALVGLMPPQTKAAESQAATAAVPQGAAAPASGRVTMIDLGAHSCIPCKMMAPIIEALQKEYEGRADIIFIDVWKNPQEAKKYGIRAIPTQIFLDREGREVQRNVGFMDKQRIVDVLTRLGVPAGPPVQ